MNIIKLYAMVLVPWIIFGIGYLIYKYPMYVISVLQIGSVLFITFIVVFISILTPGKKF